MTRAEALQCALGYAWGQIDAAHEFGGSCPVAGDVPQFAEAFADAHAALNSRLTGYVPSVQEAFSRWQASKGRTVMP